VVVVIGIVFGKTIFQLIGMDARGRIVLRQRVLCGQLPQRLGNVPGCVIGLEAYAWRSPRRAPLASLGHESFEGCPMGHGLGLSHGTARGGASLPVIR